MGKFHQVDLDYDRSNTSLEGKHVFYPISYERLSKKDKKNNHDGDALVKTLQAFRKAKVGRVTIGIMSTLQAINDYVYYECINKKELNDEEKEDRVNFWRKKGRDWYSKNNSHIDRELRKFNIEVDVIHFDQFDEDTAKATDLKFIDIAEHKQFFDTLKHNEKSSLEENAVQAEINNLVVSVSENFKKEIGPENLDKDDELKIQNSVRNYFFREAPVLRWIITSGKFDVLAYPEVLQGLNDSIANTVKQPKPFSFVDIKIKNKQHLDNKEKISVPISEVPTTFFESRQEPVEQTNGFSININTRDAHELTILSLIAYKRDYENRNNKAVKNTITEFKGNSLTLKMVFDSKDERC